VTVVYILAAAVGVVAGLVGLLRLAKAAGDRLVAGGRDDGTVTTPPVVPGQGWLNEDEERETARLKAIADALEAENRRDVERLDAAVRVMTHRLNALFERTLSQLGLEQVDRNWARLASGEYPLVGAR